MTVAIWEWQDRISGSDLGRLLNNERDLKDYLRRLLSRIVQPRQEPTPANLQFFVDYYGEQVTSDAAADIEKYFKNSQNRGFTVGTLPTGYQPFNILPRDIKPSNAAISVIGEGLAGWYLQSQNLFPLSRPIGHPIDLLFEDSQRTVFAFVQVKATQEPSVKAQLTEAAIPLLQYTLNERPSSRHITYFSNVIGVAIKPGSNFELLSLKIDIM